MKNDNLSDLDFSVTESILNQYFVRLIVPNDDILWIEHRGNYLQVVQNPLTYRFPFHSRLRELACLSRGSAYEFQYKQYPPSTYCSLHGLPDLLNFIVPLAERKHNMFSSCGVHLYFINSCMEKFKVFHGNYTHESKDKDVDPVSRTVRSIISSAVRNVLSFETLGTYLEQSLINASRRTYFGAFVDPLYSDKEAHSINQRTLPGVAAVIQFNGDKQQLQHDLERFMLINYGVMEDWMLQFS